MDDLARLLEGAAVPRRLPQSLRTRLESILLTGEAPAAEPSLKGIDAPRPLPPDLRNRLSAVIASTSRRRGWFGLAPVQITTLSAAFAAAAVLVLGALALGDGQTGRLRPPEALPSPVPTSPSDGGSGATSASPAPSPVTTQKPASGSGTSGMRTGSSGKTGASSYVFRYDEVCFPEEQCPSTAAAESSSPEYGNYVYPPRRPPSPPRNLTAQTGPGFGEITLDWDPPAESGTAPVKKYAIYRRPENGEERLIAILDAGQTTFTDSNLRFGTYSYRVKARNYDGISDFSNQTSAMAIGLVS